MINTIRERGQRSSSLESESFDHQVTNLENAKVLSELRHKANAKRHGDYST